MLITDPVQLIESCLLWAPQNLSQGTIVSRAPQTDVWVSGSDTRNPLGKLCYTAATRARSIQNEMRQISAWIAMLTVA